MLRLIEDLLDVEQIAVGKLTLHYDEHDVTEIIKEAVEEFKGDAASKQISLSAKPKEGCGYAMRDRACVMQVLSNLIGNAIKFTPANGQISVSCHRIGGEGKEVRGFSQRHRRGNRTRKDRYDLQAFLTDTYPRSSRYRTRALHCKNDGRRTSGKNMGRVKAWRRQHVSFHFSPRFC